MLTIEFFLSQGRAVGTPRDWHVGERLPAETRGGLHGAFGHIKADGDELANLVAWMQAGGRLSDPGPLENPFIGLPSSADRRDVELVRWLGKFAPQTLETWRAQFEGIKLDRIRALRAAGKRLATFLLSSSAGESLVKRDSKLAEEFAKFREALDETGFEI